MKRPTPAEEVAGFVLALVIGIAGAVLWLHWAVCEDYDRACLIAGMGAK